MIPDCEKRVPDLSHEQLMQQMYVVHSRRKEVWRETAAVVIFRPDLPCALLVDAHSAHSIYIAALAMGLQANRET
jgi:hypothetical protein